MADDPQDRSHRETLTALAAADAGKHEGDARRGRGRKGLKDDDMMKHHTMMENWMDRMLMMMEQMMQRDQMMQSMPSK